MADCGAVEFKESLIPGDPAQQVMVEETPELLEYSIAKVREIIQSSDQKMVPIEETLRRDDSFVLRFLRVQKFKVDKASELYLMYWKKREELFGNEILTFNSKIGRECMELAFLEVPNCTDKWGRQVFVMRMARMDYTKMEDQYDVLKYFWIIMDYILQKESVQKLGMCLIQNAADGSRNNFNRHVVRKVLDSIQNYIPIRQAGIYICNPPWFFGTVFKILKLFMKEKLRRRIHIIGTDVDALKDYFEDSSIPTDLSGQMDHDHNAWLTARLEECESHTVTY
eukprot:m.38632 g.38632  ORF g.38632 m.38632 type:complete len:282 (+) comp9456_c0_seq4:64-909(+)